VTIQGVEMLTLIGDLYCVGSTESTDVDAGVRRQRLDPTFATNPKFSTERNKQNKASETFPLNNRQDDL
jgi:hypothetical protein